MSSATTGEQLSKLEEVEAFRVSSDSKDEEETQVAIPTNDDESNDNPPDGGLKAWMSVAGG